MRKITVCMLLLLCMVCIVGCGKKKKVLTQEEINALTGSYGTSDITPEPTVVYMITKAPTLEPEATTQADVYNQTSIDSNGDKIEEDARGHLTGHYDITEKDVATNAVDLQKLGFAVKNKVVEPSLRLSYRNHKGWYLVDTDGDFIGDRYYKLKKKDLKKETYGVFYKFHLDNSVNKVDFLIPCQNYKQGYGEATRFE